MRGPWKTEIIAEVPQVSRGSRVGLVQTNFRWRSQANARGITGVISCLGFRV